MARVPALGSNSYAVLATPPAGVEAGIDATALVPVPAFAPLDNRESNVLGDASSETPYWRIETTHFRIYVRRDCGVLVSFIDKRVNRELVGFGIRRPQDYIDSARADLALNVLQLTDELPHRMSSWQLHELYREQSLLQGAQATIVETGPARCVIEVVHKPRQSTIRQRISFYRDLPRVDFETFHAWQEPGTKDVGVPGLKVAFTARLPDAQACFEPRFAGVRRPADGQEAPALRWADAGGPDYGIAVLNDSKYGYDILGNRVRLTLVRSPYDPDAIADVGHHQIRYAFYPHAGAWQDGNVVQAAAGFNQPLLTRLIPAAKKVTTSAPPWRLRLQGASSVQLACLKQAANGKGRIIRLYESAGRAGRITLAGLPTGAVVYTVNTVEDIIAPVSNDAGTVSLALKPWQILTLLVEA